MHGPESHDYAYSGQGKSDTGTSSKDGRRQSAASFPVCVFGRSTFRLDQCSTRSWRPRAEQNRKSLKALLEKDLERKEEDSDKADRTCSAHVWQIVLHRVEHFFWASQTSKGPTSVAASSHQNGNPLSWKGVFLASSIFWTPFSLSSTFPTRTSCQHFPIA